MAKLDLKKTLKELYQPSATKVALVRVPEFTYFMVDGAGDPNGKPEFEQAVQALYSLSYTLKFDLGRAEEGVNYAVMPLEGLWWCEDMACFNQQDKSNWLWTLLIVQPVPITPEQFSALAIKALKKKGVAAIEQVRMETWEEGLCAQVMHRGPYAEEGPTVARMHAFIAEEGYLPAGKHHELYLSDPRRVAPEKMKTVLRQPVRPR